MFLLILYYSLYYLLDLYILGVVGKRFFIFSGNWPFRGERGVSAS